MKVERTKCDNPKCDNEGIPESHDMGGPYKPPYAWIYLEKAEVVGSGPDLSGIEVCSVECLPAAVIARFNGGVPG